MGEILKIFSYYNILNCVLTGIIFIYFFRNIITLNLELYNNIIENVFIYYFFGSVFSRLGSIIVEPLCKKFKIVKYEPYDKFLSAEKLDPKISTLVEVNNFYRTASAIFLFILLIKPLYSIIFCHEVWSKRQIFFYILSSMLFLLFLLSYKKLTSYIVKRINIANEKK